MLTEVSVPELDRDLDTFRQMPKIQFKEETLNGRAHIIAYADREYLTLRIHREGTKYTNISLGTSDLKVAHNKALDVYAEVVNAPPRSRSRKFLFATACEQFLKWKQEQCDIGEVKQSSVNTYTQRIHQRIIPYANQVDIKNIGDIQKDSFDGYATHFRKVETKGRWSTTSNGLSVSTINSDLTTLNEVTSWMVKRNLMDANKLPVLTKLRNRKEFKEESNPAFMPEEWDALKASLNEWVKIKEGDDEIKKWRRRWIYNWIFFMYHFGGRPHEGMALRVGDLETKKMPDGKLKGIVHVPADTKRGKRVVVMNGHWVNSVKSHLLKGVKLRNEQIEKHNKLVDSGDIQNYRWRHQGRIPLIPKPDKDTLLFLNPLYHTINKEDKRALRKFEAEGRLDQVRWEVGVYTQESIRQKYEPLVEDALVRFYKGEAKPTDHKSFTIYSLRSTHITHSLLNGVRIRVIADNCGTSESEIESTYYRLNNLLNIEELGFHRKKVSQSDDLVPADA